MTRRSIAAAVWMLSAACSDVAAEADLPGDVDTTGDGDTTGGGEGGVLTPAGFGRRFARATCAKVFECCSPTDLRALFVTFPESAITEATGCEEYYERYFTGFDRRVAASVVGERAAWDGEAAAACVERVKAMNCREYSLAIAARGAGAIDCRVLTGKVAEAGACRRDWECASGYCSGAMQWNDGTCAAWSTVGEDCPDGRCEAGAWCDVTQEKWVCAARKADGEKCRDAAECRSNGCSAQPSRQGVCAATMCDGTGTGDEDVAPM